MIRFTENFHCRKKLKILNSCKKRPGKIAVERFRHRCSRGIHRIFDSYDKAKAHLDAGAKRVVITAPVKDDMAITFTPNVYSEDISKSKITSNASCTTNAITPLISILAKIRVSKKQYSTLFTLTRRRKVLWTSPTPKIGGE